MNVIQQIYIFGGIEKAPPTLPAIWYMHTCHVHVCASCTCIYMHVVVVDTP